MGIPGMARGRGRQQGVNCSIGGEWEGGEGWRNTSGLVAPVCQGAHLSRRKKVDMEHIGISSGVPNVSASSHSNKIKLSFTGDMYNREN